MSKSSALSLGPEWTRLKSGSSKVLKDDKSVNPNNGDRSKVKLPWSGIAAGGLTGTTGNNSNTNNNNNNGSGNTSLKKKNSGGLLSPELNNGGGGVFAISAAAGGSGLFGSKKGSGGNEENERSVNGGNGGNSNSIPYRVGSTRLTSYSIDHDVTTSLPSKPVKLRNNHDGKKYSSKQMLEIWDQMKDSKEYKEVKKVAVNDLGENSNVGNPTNSGNNSKHHHYNNHHHNYNNHHHNNNHNHHNGSFTSKLFTPFGRYKTSNDLYYSNSVTGPIKYEAPPKEYDVNKRYNRDEERSNGGNDGSENQSSQFSTQPVSQPISQPITQPIQPTYPADHPAHPSQPIQPSHPTQPPSSNQSSVLPNPLSSSTDSWSPFGNFSIAPIPSIPNPSTTPSLSNKNNSSSNLIELTKPSPSSDFFNSPIKRVTTPSINPTGTPPPPGITSPVPTSQQSLLSPENIQWFYKDPSGVEQGPFSGKLMHDWYAGNWLKENLLIKRVGELEYIRLQDFKLKVGNFSDPFRVPLPPVLPSPQPSFAFPQPPGPYFEDLQRDIFRQPFAPPPPPPNTNAWGSSSPGPISPISPWNQHLQPQSNFLGSSISPAIVPPASSSINQSLWKGVESVQDSVIGNESVNEVVEGVKKVNIESEEVKEESKEVEPIVQPQLDAEPVSSTEPISQPIAEPIAEPITKPIAEPQSTPIIESQPQPVLSKAEKKLKKKSKPIESIEPLPQHVPTEPIEIAEPVSSKSPTPPTPPTLAPWAKNDPKPKTLSLKEIQELEAAKRAKQTAIQKELHHQQVLAARISSPPSLSSNVTLPTSAKWGTSVSSTATPKKTLAEIQKEEELAAAAAKRRASQTQITPSQPTILPAGKKYAEIAVPSKPSPIPANPPTTAAWTTVGPGGRKVSSPLITGPATASTLKRPTTTTATTAAPLRSVISSTTKPPTASDEFLQWCKATLQDLNTGINQNELLSILLSLPPTPDSKEIIAETIYSNSSTMDGRRFAEDFLKKRNLADKEKSGETWSDILQRNATIPTKAVENDGWNPAFKVVKKKNKRNDQF